MAVAIERFLGRTGINVMTRVMALIVAAIGVNFIMTGIKSELPGLASQQSRVSNEPVSTRNLTMTVRNWPADSAHALIFLCKINTLDR
ncbi:MarC family protein [Bradyrhizobium zhanjiangense]|uniref:UPF0056 membrane protein n=1 Tax=Bradyrhizobium zhanjiangense TaxID=1325107 RepID=A0A4Q0SIV9_9BRAD|nr:MarC family protein [Bradyrhizobium zhanjiangense]RXH39565.1 hypothetical protein XH94_16785 [Bradyrhizobium zhanjiangense]